MSEFVDRVKQGLLQLKKLKVNPVADEDDILDFEDAYNCKLPEAYRDFLTQIGNGGAGPSFGILPLGEDYNGEWPDYIKPNLPFPFTQAHNDTSILYKAELNQNSYASVQEYQEACEEWLDEHREELFTAYCHAHMLNGAIPIVDHGCALSCWLVVAEGPEYGHVWEDRVPDREGVFPYHSRKRERYTFDQWYLEWLEHRLRL